MRRRDVLKLLLLTPLGRLALSGIAALGAAAPLFYEAPPPRRVAEVAEGEVELPLPRLRGSMSVEEAIARRRSVREYLGEPLRLEELAQMLWAAYGISEVRHGLRTAPSAGALYPLEVYAAVGEGGVEAGGGSLQAGVYRYLPRRHAMALVKRGDVRRELYEAALEQPWVLKAPVSLVVTAVYERTGRVYGERGVVRYVHMDLGHLGQNVYLQATALGLGTVAVGAFHDEAVREAIGAPPEEVPLYIMPVGRAARLHNITEEELAEYFTSQKSGFFGRPDQPKRDFARPSAINIIIKSARP